MSNSERSTANNRRHKASANFTPERRALNQGGIVKAICREIIEQYPDIDLEAQFDWIVDAANTVVNNVDSRTVLFKETAA